MTKSILLIGEADTTYGLNQIIKQKSPKLVSGLYGSTSKLTTAFNYCQSLGVNEVYLANVQTKTAYIDVLQMAGQYDFTYIVPMGVHFGDRVYNKTAEREMSYAEVFLRIVTSMCNSILIMTDNEASLYEDIDAFLDDMKNKIKRFKIEADSILDNGRQLWFVANNLDGVSSSNVLLGALMTMTELPKYPTGKLPNAIFDIDEYDVGNSELIYFKSNRHTTTSIENFVNFHNEATAYKIAMIDMVIRKINQDIDLSGFKGKLFNNQTKLKIKSMLKDYLESIKGKLIRSYSIQSIDSYLLQDYTYLIVTNFTILPVNSLEECQVVIEV